MKPDCIQHKSLLLFITRVLWIFLQFRFPVHFHFFHFTIHHPNSLNICIMYINVVRLTIEVCWLCVLSAYSKCHIWWVLICLGCGVALIPTLVSQIPRIVCILCLVNCKQFHFSIFCIHIIVCMDNFSLLRCHFDFNFTISIWLSS